MQSSTVAAGDRPPESVEQFKREVARRIAGLRLLPVGIPALGALFIVVIIGSKLVAGLAIADSLYNEPLAIARSMLVIVGLVGILSATHSGFLIAQGVYHEYFKAYWYVLRSSVGSALTSVSASRPTGAVNASTGELLAEIERQFYRACRAQRISLMPPGLISIRASVIFAAVLALAGLITLGYRLSLSSLPHLIAGDSTPTLWKWARTALPEFGAIILLACAIAVLMVLTAGYAARRVALYRLLLEDPEILADIGRSGVGILAN